MRILEPSEWYFLAAFLTYIAIRGVFEKKVGVRPSAETRHRRLEAILLAVVFVGALLLPVLHLATRWLAFADYSLPRAAQWAGVFLVPLALWLFIGAHTHLGTNWSRTLGLRQDHILVTHGVYRRVRHPMYAAIWLFSLAQGLLLHNWLAGWSAMAAFGLMYFLRVPREEEMMRSRFREEYDAYARRTGRIFPRLLRLSRPE